ncbi:MAG: acyl--CoA ligase [Kordiimonadaceae bacterium]|nr:acyl--CoA ligase [Kordiimonadaceae bacterium]
MRQESDAFAVALLEQNVKAGDKLLVHMENCPEFLITMFACARIGAVAVTTNSRSVARDIEYYIETAGIVGAVTQPAFARLVATTAPQLNFLIVTDTDSGAAPEAYADVAHTPFQECLKTTEKPQVRRPDPAADFLIQFTSGTTSRPKPVLLTHGNFVWGAQMNARNFNATSDDIALVFSPLFHINAVSYSTMTTLWVGGTMVLQPRLSVSRFWDVSLRNKCTWTFVIPFLVYPLMQMDAPENHNYRFWMIGGYSAALRKKFNIEVVCAWGMTETITQGIISCFHHTGPDGAIGRAAPCYTVEVRDEDGKRVGPGGKGVLFIKGIPGVSLFKEYFRDPDATKAIIDEDGWLDSGDSVSIDEEGNFYFLGREKDMLKVGAENIAALEIESVIMQTGLVEECAVVAQKHYILDEVPVAFVIPKSGEHEGIRKAIMDACAKNLADFKQVRDVIFVDDFPRATLGKVMKVRLREQLPLIESDD